MRQKLITVDGNEAAASVAFRCNESIAIYPITPSSAMAELCDVWASQGRTNIWGAIPQIAEMQSEAGPPERSTAPQRRMIGSHHNRPLTVVFTTTAGAFHFTRSTPQKSARPLRSNPVNRFYRTPARSAHSTTSDKPSLASRHHTHPATFKST